MVFTFLDGVPLGTDVRVTGVDLEPALVRWLQAIGLEEGTTVRVLRRAIWGGPLHVRTSNGGELAIHRALARAIRIDATSLGTEAAGVEAARGPSVRKAEPEVSIDLAPVSQSTA